MGNDKNHFDRLKGIFNKSSQLVVATWLKNRRRFPIFVAFLALASIFWYIRALNDSYEAEIRYPVKYSDFPHDKFITSELPENLTLQVYAKGSRIVVRQLNLATRPLRINVRSVAASSENLDRFYIATNQIRDYLSDNLENMRVLRIRPDTLFFDFEEVVSRYIQVKVNFENRATLLARQHIINGDILVFPDSIKVTGPISVVGQVKYVETKPLKVTNLIDTAERFAAFKSIANSTFEEQRAKVFIPVDKYTEKIVNVPVKPVNVPDSLILKTFPSFVKITFRVALSHYDNITENSFSASVDYSDLTQGVSEKLHISLADTPKYLSNLRITPTTTDYIIEYNVENRSNRGNW